MVYQSCPASVEVITSPPFAVSSLGRGIGNHCKQPPVYINNMPANRTKTKAAVAPGTPTSEASSRRSLSIRRRADDRAPLSDLTVNDDEAERQSRRKSGNATVFPERSKRRTSGLRKQVEDNDDAADTPDDDNDDSYGATKAGEKKRKTTAGAALDRSTGGLDSQNTSTRTKKARLSVVSRQQGQNSMIVPVHGAGDKAAVPQVSMEIMSSNFEEWMKMATDNVSVVRKP